MVDGTNSSLPLARGLSRRIGSARVAEYPEIDATLAPWIPTILVFTERLSPRSPMDRVHEVWVTWSALPTNPFVAVAPSGPVNLPAWRTFLFVLLRLDPEARARSLIVRVPLREELPVRLQCQRHCSLG